jgi:hypothetical protein
MKREGALTDGSAGCIENTHCAPSVWIAHGECGWKGDDSLGPAVVNLDPDRVRSIPMFSFARRALFCLAAAAVKAQDELAALGLDGRLSRQKSPDIRAKENIRYELTQPQNTLTPTGLLMEGRVTQ